MSYRLHLEFPVLAKTLNEILYKNRWFIKREKDLWQSLITPLLINRLPQAPLGKAKITLIRHSSKETDFDNRVVAGKFILDCLKGKVIADDNIVSIGVPEYLWKKAPPKKGKMELIVEEVIVPCPQELDALS